MKKPWLLVIPGFLLASLLLAQTGQVVPNENLVAEGIPPVSATLADAVDRYSNFRGASLASWHPEHREMLIYTRFADTSQVHSVKMPGGARTQLTFFRDRVGAARYPPKKGDSFVFSKDVGGAEFFQLYRYDLANGDITLLTDGNSRNTGAVWSNAGDKLAYGSTRRNGKDVDVYLVEPRNPKSDRMFAQLEGGGWQAIDWAPNDRAILLLDEVSANESYLWLANASSDEKTLLTPRTSGEQVAYGPARFSKDGKGIYVTTDRDSEFLRLAYLDLATRQYKYLTSHIHWDVDDFDLSPDGKTIAFVSNEDGFGVLHLLDTTTGRETPASNLPRGIISGVRWHNNGKDLGFNLSSSASPSDVYSLDTQTGKIERWTFGETGGLNTAGFSQPELIHWKRFDGKMISGFLYQPPARFTGRHPVIVNIHGGPEGQFRPGFLDRNNYYLKELGIAIIYPNIRGSSGYGKSFLALDNGFLREGAYKDIGALLEWIRSQPHLDGDRIMVTGGSYGGHMTLATAVFYNDLLRCSVDVVGMSNLVTFLEHTSPYRQDLRRVEYGDERDPKMRAFLEKIAPLNHAQNITKPLFVIQGMNDPRVPRSEAEQMVATVRKNGTPVWYLMAKDEGHGFAKKKNSDFQFYSTVLFVKEFLLK